MPTKARLQRQLLKARRRYQQIQQYTQQLERTHWETLTALRQAEREQVQSQLPSPEEEQMQTVPEPLRVYRRVDVYYRHRLYYVVASDEDKADEKAKAIDPQEDYVDDESNFIETLREEEVEVLTLQRKQPLFSKPEVIQYVPLHGDPDPDRFQGYQVDLSEERVDPELQSWPKADWISVPSPTESE